MDSVSPHRDVEPLLEIAPLLGVCYGMQLICHQLGGKVSKANLREYGLNQINWEKPLLDGVKSQNVWMSHGDYIESLPPQLDLLAKSQSGHIAVAGGDRILCYQFHPEVIHTERGEDLLKHFVFDMCKTEPNWTSDSIVEDLKAKISRQIGPGESVVL